MQMNEHQLQQKAALLENTLQNFHVDARVLNVTQGSSVTRYEVQPAVGVKVSSITKLADDIALNLRAKSIRIEPRFREKRPWELKWRTRNRIWFPFGN